MKITKKFRTADSFQQMIGGIIISGPFVVTEEVWRLGSNLQFIQFVLILSFNLVIGYAALYKADKSRDVNIEQDVYGIPIRLISLQFVGYFSVLFLVLILGPNITFDTDMQSTIFSMAICSIFGIVGAATADSIF